MKIVYARRRRVPEHLWQYIDVKLPPRGPCDQCRIGPRMPVRRGVCSECLKRNAKPAFPPARVLPDDPR